MGKRTASGRVVSQLTHSMRALAHSCAINHAPYANTVAAVEKLIKPPRICLQDCQPAKK